VEAALVRGPGAVDEPWEHTFGEPERDFRIQGDELMLGDGMTARRLFERLG
jgi:hypothetical protein